MTSTTCTYFNPVDIGSQNYRSAAFGSSTCVTTGFIEIGYTSSTTSSTLTQGDLISGTFLLLIFSVLMYWFFIANVRGQKIRL